MTVTAPTSTTTTAAATGATGAALVQNSVDYNMFLKLLTTQMQNQDPLKPMDSTEYTQQLAQFSQVEQTVRQTGTLNDILAQLTTQNMAQASGFIGQTAQFDYAVSGMSADTPAQWQYSATSPISALTATITDASGKTVLTREITPDQRSDFSWDGTLANGGTAAAGAYTLSLNATSGSGNTVPVSISTSGRVDEVVSAGGSVTLSVNGVDIPMSKLTKLAR